VNLEVLFGRPHKARVVGVRLPRESASLIFATDIRFQLFLERCAANIPENRRSDDPKRVWCRPTMFPEGREVWESVRCMAMSLLQRYYRFKNGNDHCYQSIVEKICTARGLAQRPLLRLGMINDSQKAAWTTVTEMFDPVQAQILHSRCIRRIGPCPSMPASMACKCA
jgi:hypothetical protein